MNHRVVSREQVLRKRPYLQEHWCVEVITYPDRREVQIDGRLRFWGYIPELAGKALQVVTLEGGETVHNAFPDSSYPRRQS